jgi:hypothetical protein
MASLKPRIEGGHYGKRQARQDPTLRLPFPEREMFFPGLSLSRRRDIVRDNLLKINRLTIDVCMSPRVGEKYRKGNLGLAMGQGLCYNNIFPQHIPLLT